MSEPIVIENSTVRLRVEPEPPKNARERRLAIRDLARRIRGWIHAHPASGRPRFERMVA